MEYFQADYIVQDITTEELLYKQTYHLPKVFLHSIWDYVHTENALKPCICGARHYECYLRDHVQSG